MAERQIPDRDPGFAPHTLPANEPDMNPVEPDTGPEPVKEVERKFDEARVHLPPG